MKLKLGLACRVIWLGMTMARHDSLTPIEVRGSAGEKWEMGVVRNEEARHNLLDNSSVPSDREDVLEESY